MNGRKARQLRSQGGQKRTRRFLKKNRATAAEFNAAREAIEAERIEAEADFDALMESLKAEPQYAIVSPFTGEVLMLAAQSMIHPLDVGEVEPFDATTEVTPLMESVAAENHRIERETAEYFHGDEDRVLTDQASYINRGENAPKIILPGTAEALGIEPIETEPIFP